VNCEFEDLFDGTLGDWNTEPISFELKRDAKPYHGSLANYVRCRCVVFVLAQTAIFCVVLAT